MTDYKTPVKASKLIAALEKTSYTAKIVDVGDLYPFLSSVEVEVDSDTYVCSLIGYYGYYEDSCMHGINGGRSEATVLGVTFSRSILNDDADIEISGRDIEYDEDLDEEDVTRAVIDSIDFVNYDPDDFPFDEDSVTDSDILENLDCEYSVFALNASGDLCAFDSEDEIPGYCDNEEDIEEDEEGECGKSEDACEYKIISEDEAYDILSKMRPDFWESI